MCSGGQIVVPLFHFTGAYCHYFLTLALGMWKLNFLCLFSKTIHITETWVKITPPPPPPRPPREKRKKRKKIGRPQACLPGLSTKQNLVFDASLNFQVNLAF